MTTFEDIIIPDLTKCPQCGVEWSEHPLGCGKYLGFENCEIKGLHCHQLLFVGTKISKYLVKP